MTNDDVLIKTIRRNSQSLPMLPPLMESEVQEAERRLEFRLPPPSAEEGAAMVEAGVEHLAQSPERVLSVCDQGCNMYSCVDCSKPELPVFFFDGSRDHDVFVLEAPSLYTWFRGGFEVWPSWDAAPKRRFDEGESVQSTVDTTDVEGKGSDDAVLP
jgi:hypothetical protein